MKIKTIDLLFKIANNEDVPKKIKFEDKIWKYNSSVQDYMNEDNNEYLFANIFGMETEIVLNREVEIIEEEKKIEHCISFDEFISDNSYSGAYEEYLTVKIDKLIDEVNKLNEKMLMAYDSEEVVESKE